MPRATATETVERVEHLQGMILAGQPNTACLTFARQTWGLTVPGLTAAEESLATDQEDIDESGINWQELLFWSIQTLKAATGEAMQQMDPDAVVASIRQLNRRLALGTTSTEAMAHAFEIHHSFLKTTYWRSNQTAFG